MSKIEVVPHDPRWREEFDKESAQIAAALGKNVAAIHHIGSTSIPGIYAKPVIDMLVEVEDIAEVESRSAEMGSLGYEVMGEFGIAGRRYFRKDDSAGVRTHQVHAFEAGSPDVVRHLAFRDYMITHPEEARAYSELKRKLAAEHPYSMDAYMDGKDGFIKEIDTHAAVWRRSQRTVT